MFNLSRKQSMWQKMFIICGSSCKIVLYPDKNLRKFLHIFEFEAYSQVHKIWFDEFDVEEVNWSDTAMTSTLLKILRMNWKAGCKPDICYSSVQQRTGSAHDISVQVCSGIFHFQPFSSSFPFSPHKFLVILLTVQYWWCWEWPGIYQ